MSTDDPEPQPPTPATARRLVLLGLVPFVGVLLFAVAGVLTLRAFSHNNSLSCGGGPVGFDSGSCSHYSYVPPIVIGIVAVALVIGGGAFASYYAMRNVGLPLFDAIRRRRD